MQLMASKDVEILRNRSILKTWVVKRIADTPVATPQEQEVVSWFHDLPVENRSRLVTDLARLGIAGVDLEAIASGPLGDLFGRLPHLFHEEEARLGTVSSTEEDESVTLGVFQELETTHPEWSEQWNQFELDLEEASWDGN